MVTDCKKCRLWQMRRNIVPGRGRIPADILFMGEAPGKNEDVLGEAFVGAAGKLLDRMMIDAAQLARLKIPTYYITNTILCHPTDTFAGDNRPPKPDEVLACISNVIGIIQAVQPRVIVFIGKVAEKYYKKEFPGSFSIQHPAFLLRQGGKSSPWYKTNIRNLAEIFRRSQ